jgi:hypothetical protein
MWREHGITLFMLGSDHGFLRSGAAELRRVAGFSLPPPRPEQRSDTKTL